MNWGRHSRNAQSMTDDVRRAPEPSYDVYANEHIRDQAERHKSISIERQAFQSDVNQLKAAN